MLRRTMLFMVCLSVLIPACAENSEPEPQQRQGRDVAARENLAKAPPGMAVIEGVGDGPVFIRKKPVTIGEYMQFLTTIGRPVPEKWTSENTDAQRPVTGLTLQEARKYATWQLGRLPTAAEWRRASSVVGEVKYPWDAGTGAETPRPDARLFLVQDYLPGSQGEQAAEQAREELKQEMQSKRVDEIVALQDKLDASLRKLREDWKSVWQEIKPAFFSHLKSKSRSARLQSEQDLRQSVVGQLNEVASLKRKLVNLTVEKASSDELEQAAQEYKALLTKLRGQIGEKVQELTAKKEELTERTLDRKTKLEQAGQNWMSQKLVPITEMQEKASKAGGTLGEAVQARDLLQDALDRLGKSAPDVEQMRRLARSYQNSARQADREAEKLEAQTGLEERIEEAKKTLKDFSEYVGKEFPQEEELIQDLNQLVEKSVPVKTLRAEVAELKSMLEKLGGRPAPEEQ